MAESAATAMAAMQSAQKTGKPFRLLLIDVNMPQMDGFTLTEWIRQTPPLTETLVMILSSSGLPGDGGR